MFWIETLGYGTGDLCYLRGDMIHQMLVNLNPALNTCGFETESYGKANYQINVRSMQLNGVLRIY
jgi:hypothetical protein